MEEVLTNTNVLGVIFEFLDLTSLRYLACSCKSLWSRVKNYPLWSTLLDEEMKLIVVDRMDAMSLWSLWRRSGKQFTTQYQVCLTGVQMYPVDSDLERRYGASATLLSLNPYYFMIQEQVVNFIFLSLPKNMTCSMICGTTQGAVVIINTSDQDWQEQLESVWRELQCVQGLQALVLYADELVNQMPLMREIRQSAVVMKMDVLTLDAVRNFYGTLGRLCKENKARMETVSSENQSMSSQEVTKQDHVESGQPHKGKRCGLM